MPAGRGAHYFCGDWNKPWPPCVYLKVVRTGITAPILHFSKQWAYKGKPLYFFKSDKTASDRTGDKFQDVWHVIKE